MIMHGLSLTARYSPTGSSVHGILQEYWSGLPFPSPGDPLDSGTELTSPALAGGFFTTETPGQLLIFLIPFSTNK